MRGSVHCVSTPLSFVTSYPQRFLLALFLEGVYKKNRTRRMATLSCPSPNPKEEGSSNVASQPVSVGCVCPECSIFNVYRRIGEKQVKVGMFTRTSKCEVCHSVLHWKRAVVMENGKPNGSTVEITEHNPRRTHQQATRLQMLKSAYAQANFV